MQKVNVVVFDGFESLDVFGPVGVFGGFAEEYEIKYYSLEGGIVTSAQNAELQTLPFSVMEQGILLVPGGRGTRELVKDRFFIKKLRELATEATYVISVCTGAALLAKAGILKGKKATSNQRAFDWVQQQDPEVDWGKDVRWICEDTVYTSAGITTGIDMALGFICDCHGKEKAQEIAQNMEYRWEEAE